ncbi:argininosuccinate lyase [Ferrovibrio xuzhouensis]|uniref:Argininosuccinate lyase n=1 Tax=Ferrovibrio xuzhouensis TaxID=1576914 RepID=A0ABV7VHT0_9PROT
MSGGNHGDEPTRLWGARFRTPPDPALMALSRSPASHWRLIPYDIISSMAHARELERAGLLTATERGDICAMLQAILDDFTAGRIAPTEADEDIHTFVERVMTERLGPLGGKLRAGRSRNDQSANDLRLYLRHQSRRLVRGMLALQAVLIGQAEANIATIAPGFTHLQPAQPVLFAHQLLAHGQAFSRDIARLQDWDSRFSRSPLGAAALAGSAIAMHPELAAAELGYAAPTENSIDAVGNRDHVAEFLFALAMHGVHLSRLSEEIVLWSSRQFRWIALDDGFATGSSIMPQKKNADIAEITRGRSARLIGDLATMLVALKGLPLAYNRDLIEDKAAAFDAIDALTVVQPAITGLIRSMTVNVATLHRQSTEGFTLATEVADWLSRRGVPFAQAHEITGAVVRLCEERGIELEQLSAADLALVDPRLDISIKAALTPEAAVAARQGYGGTAPARVREQLGRLQQLCATQSDWCDTYRGPMPGA